MFVTCAILTRVVTDLLSSFLTFSLRLGFQFVWRSPMEKRRDESHFSGEGAPFSFPTIDAAGEGPDYEIVK